MRSRRFTTEAVILKRFNYGEGDRILTLFTRNFGKMTVIAKGVRKPKSRKRGHVELFNHVKAHVVRGKGMGLLTEAESVFSPLEERLGGVSLDNEANLDRLFYAYQFTELIDRLLPDEEINQEIFSLLVKSLQALKGTEVEVKSLDGYFKNRLVRILGFWPSDRSVPVDVDQLLDEILERPLNTPEIWRQMIGG